MHHSKKDRLAAVSPKFDLTFSSDSKSRFPLPAPAEQTQHAEASGEEWESGWEGRFSRIYRIAVDRYVVKCQARIKLIIDPVHDSKHKIVTAGVSYRIL